MTAHTLPALVTPMEAWIADEIGCGAAPLTREALQHYQLEQLRETLRMVQERSSFYREQLRGVRAESIASLDNLRRLPFTTSADLESNSARFLCVSQSQVERVVSMDTSGTSGPRKRLFFTAADQERSLRFFQHGVLGLAHPGERMLIALPGERHGSVGRLLAAGVERAGLTAIPCGMIGDPVAALALMERERVTTLIGFPVQVLELASQRGSLARRALANLRSVVLCSDHVPEPLVQTLCRRLRCGVFEHYGMTETGLGGGVDCIAHHGYHLREADFLFEVIDPLTGEPLPAGVRGELVFTTLQRQAMPLIRYRTGDLTSFAPRPCPCGSVLPTLQRITGRVGAAVEIGGGHVVTMPQLDDALFAVPGVLDFQANVLPGTTRELQILCRVAEPVADATLRQARQQVAAIPAVQTALAADHLRLSLDTTTARFPFTGAKRVIQEGPRE